MDARRRILVVDDDRLVLTAVGRLLGSLGYDVLSAGSGPEALKTLSSVDGAVDLVLTDFRMPEMDGRALRGEIETTYPNLPVVLMSGDLPDPAVLPKPITRNALRLVLLRAWQGSGE